jgi:hypothetical protein
MSNQSILTNVSSTTPPLLDLDVFCSNATDTLSLAVCTLSQALTDYSTMNQTTTTTPTTPNDAETESSSLDIAMFVLLAVRRLQMSSQASAQLTPCKHKS